jgi:hypothetical protein
MPTSFPLLPVLKLHRPKRQLTGLPCMVLFSWHLPFSPSSTSISSSVRQQHFGYFPSFQTSIQILLFCHKDIDSVEKELSLVVQSITLAGWDPNRAFQIAGGSYFGNWLLDFIITCTQPWIS